MSKEIQLKNPTVKPKRALSITQAARDLGVTREHLSRVLHGHRQSRRLTSHYRLLIAEHERQIAA